MSCIRFAIDSLSREKWTVSKLVLLFKVYTAIWEIKEIENKPSENRYKEREREKKKGKPCFLVLVLAKNRL